MASDKGRQRFMSYYENRIKELEARIEEMAQRERLKAIPIEAKLFNRWAELVKENERLIKAGDAMAVAIKRTLKSVYYIPPSMLNPSLDKWNAAKEGKDL